VGFTILDYSYLHGFAIPHQGSQPNAPTRAALLAFLWIFIFAALPLFNRDHLRSGDLVAGTPVVRSPEPVLLPDLAEAPAFQPARKAADQEIVFTREQLDIYGVWELQVLEDILRRDDEGTLERKKS
jgi:hypothetical protein